MHILIILPGTRARSGAKAAEVVEAAGTDNKLYMLDRLELVNNFATIEAIRLENPDIKISVRHVVDRSSPIALLHQAIGVNRWCRAQEVSLVHQFWGGPSAFVFSRLLRAPYILSLLGSDLLGAYNSSGKLSRKGRMLRWFTSAACKQADHLVVMSSAMLKKLPAATTSKAIVVPESMRPGLFYVMNQLQCVQHLHWAASQQHVLFFDNGARVKNRRLADEVMQLVSRTLPNTRMVVVRGVPQEELVHYYNAADALLVTSLHEGSNNSIKEAMACNCPVVTVPAGDAKQRLENVAPGYVASSYAANEIAEAMISILNLRQRSNGAEHLDAFMPATIGKQLGSLYRRVATKPSLYR